VQRSGSTCWLLVRLFEAHAEIIRFEREADGWVRRGNWPVEGFDRLHAAAQGKLLVLTIENAPTNLAWSVFFGVDDAGLAFLGRLGHVITRLWDDQDETYAELLGGQVYALGDVAAAIAGARRKEARPLRAVVYDVKGHWGVREFLPRYDHDYGFIDRDGQLIIAHQFTSAHDFEGGHARVAHAGPRLFGLIDHAGGCFLPHHYSWIGPLSGGCRRVSRGRADILGRMPESALWGLIRQDGSAALAPIALAVRDVSGGYAAVKLDDGLWNLIHCDGAWLMTQGATDCGDMCDGRCAMLSGGRWGFVDASGAWVIDPRFSKVHAFREGVAGVQSADAPGFRFIDKQGRQLGDTTFDEVDAHFSGLARVRIGERWGFADTSGRLVIAAEFEKAFRFSGGMAAVQIGEKWTWVDPTGRRLCKPRFDRTFDARDGVGVFELGARRGYFTAAGDLMAEGFEGACDFSEERAAVQVRARWGFIDATGELVIPPRFSNVKGFSEGLAVVRQGGSWGAIDASGQMVLPPQFAECGSFHEGRAVVRRGA
jgi:hypothetical protein